MTKLTLTFSMALMLACATAGAQEPNVFENPGAAPGVRPGAAAETRQITPEMYRYLADLQRYGGPTDLTRQRAQLKAQQRMERMASAKWYGMSNSRPQASATPFMGSYSPTWSSNSPNPFVWRDYSNYRTSHWVNEAPDTDTTRR
ncbi:MAG TPA: hypothetical protein VL096_10710 [Pirellulaceae bacterium]|nr:hypothetical protein [Pirellulaceae bacterium]